MNNLGGSILASQNRPASGQRLPRQEGCTECAPHLSIAVGQYGRENAQSAYGGRKIENHRKYIYIYICLYIYIYIYIDFCLSLFISLLLCHSNVHSCQRSWLYIFFFVLSPFSSLLLSRINVHSPYLSHLSSPLFSPLLS